ncbi:MAG TPA: hypothetical protein DCM32_02990 [Xanthomonadaceae bacterium]|nr:hypothetical protein [Xanthomonadaceae bacterium]
MVASSSLLSRITRSRKTLLVAFAIALGTLLLAAVWFTAARSALGDAYAEAGTAKQELAAARQRLQEAELRVRLAENANALVIQAKAEGLVEARWGERLINVSQAPLPRADVNHLLASVARNDSRIFGAETFELSVTRPDEGLFDATDPRSPPLQLTLRGTLLFRTGEAP